MPHALQDQTRNTMRPAVIFGAAEGTGLVLRKAEIHERLSEPFLLDLECWSPNEEIDLEPLIGTPIGMALPTPRGTDRWFNGLIAEASVEESMSRRAVVRLGVRPAVWFLDSERDCRIFQEKTAIEIVKQLCSERGIRISTEGLERRYEPRTYCVQYRESTFHFISRLLEEEGVYYRFNHLRGEHEFELMDSLAMHNAEPSYDTLRYHPMCQDLLDEEHAWGLKTHRQFRSSAFAATDFDFEKPSKQLFATRRETGITPAGNYEHFDYPGDYLRPDEGERLAAIRLEQIRSQSRGLSFRSDARGLRTGALVSLRSADGTGSDREIMIAETRITIANDEGDSGSQNQSGENTYEARIEAIDSREQFRPPLARRRVLVEGPQTAMVVGPEGEEIYTDEHGRVKVQFHWDRYGRRDQRSSCWVRVSEPWAGKGWGGLQVPRIDQEVIVDFLEGDPDRPIITGRVYNGANKPPVELPGGKMISGMRSKTYKGGGNNEITFDDSDEGQKLFVNAQRDKVVNVNNNRATTVGVDSFEEVGSNLKLDVGSNQSVHVKANADETIDVDKSISVGNNLTIDAGNSISITCGASKITMNKAGFITISGTVISIQSTIITSITAPVVTAVAATLLKLAGGVSWMSSVVATHVNSANLTKVKGSKVEVEASDELITKGNTINSSAAAEHAVLGAPVKLN